MSQKVAVESGSSPVLDGLLEEFRGRRPLRAGSLILTVFGDSLLHHGNRVWLTDLIQALHPFGLNERLIRTAVYRLVGDGWLVATRRGRRSYYELTDSGQTRFTIAARRIYRARRDDWDGRWVLVVPELLPEADRERLQRELSWLGFGAISGNVMAHPTSHREALDKVLEQLGWRRQVLVMDAATGDSASSHAMEALAMRCWDLSALGDRYDDFYGRFRPIKRVELLTDEASFQLRTLLIHEYRRILLRDSDLPYELLPSQWPGHRAAALAADLYRQCEAGAERFVASFLAVRERPLAIEDAYYQRFNGLVKSTAKRQTA